MTNNRTRLLSGAILVLVPALVFPQAIVLEAVTDFDNIESGVVPYYLDLAGGRDALAINAGIESYRDKFAKADHVFNGPQGVYNITLNTLGEIDGEGDYHLLIDGVVMGQAVNPPVVSDFQIVSHAFPNINLATGTVISVESNAVSNDTIPEGNAYAFARGRWRSLALDPVSMEAAPSDESVNLSVSAVISDTAPSVGDRVTITLSVVNSATETTATTPVVTVVLHDNLSFAGSTSCSLEQTTVSCALPEIVPGMDESVSFSVEILNSGETELLISAVADQSDSDDTNNAVSLAIVVNEDAKEVDEMPTGEPAVDSPGVDSPVVDSPGVDSPGVDENENDPDAMTDPSSPDITASSSSGGGAVSVVWLSLLLLINSLRLRRRCI